MSKRLGNAADPFETLAVWPDATRWYMISNANPDNLKFDLEGIAEVRRKFFGTLYNYSFFVFCMLISTDLNMMRLKFH
jgi:isoleucyl-tRNA synthetase